MSRIMIAGGAGFLGSHLCEALLRGGHEVSCLDNLSSGLEENISAIKSHERFTFIKHDLRLGLSSLGRYDVVVNLASRASRREWETIPIEVLTTNADGSRVLLEYAVSCDARYVCMSSSEIYGDAELVPTPETYFGRVSSIDTRSSYDEGKRYAEALVMAYHRQHSLKTTILRLFNTYGPRIRGGNAYGRVIPRFVGQAISNSPLTIYGDGSQTRSFIYVDDAIEAISQIIESSHSGEVFNVGSSREVSIKTLAEMVMKIVQSDSKLEYLSLPSLDPKRRCPDISRLSRTINWKPTVSLEEGLNRFVSWYRLHAGVDSRWH